MVQGQDTKRLRTLARPSATLGALAEEAGVSRSLVYKVAAGTRKPNKALRVAVERLFGVPATQVFGDEIARSRQSKRRKRP